MKALVAVGVTALAQLSAACTEQGEQPTPSPSPSVVAAPADPVRPADPRDLIGGFWPAADGQRLISLSDELVAHPDRMVTLTDEETQWFSSPFGNLRSATISVHESADLRAAGDAVQSAKRHIIELVENDKNLVPSASPAVVTVSDTGLLIAQVDAASDSVLWFLALRLGLRK
ncbi:hypothetical protein [Mycobacteroides abscessus]